MRWTRIANLIALPVLVCGLLILLTINNRDAATGELVFEEETIHVGTIPMWETEPIVKRVKARNVGRRTLIIRQVDDTCSCYSVVEHPDELAPGMVGTFVIHAHPAKAKPESSIRVVTDSLSQPDVYLALLAKVQPYAEFSRPVCDFGEVHTGNMHEQSIQLSIHAPVDISVTELPPSDSDFVDWGLERQGDSTFQVMVQLGPLDTPGFFSHLLSVILPGERTLTLPIIARVIPHVHVEPEVLLYQFTEPGETQTLALRLRGETSFTILKTEHSPVLEVTFGSSPDAAQVSFQGKVSLSPAQVSGILREEIRLFTDAEPEPVRIPVYAAIASNPLAEVNSPPVERTPSPLSSGKHEPSL